MHTTGRCAHSHASCKGRCSELQVPRCERLLTGRSFGHLLPAQALVDELSDYSDEAECCDSGSELSEWDDVQSNGSSGSGSPGRGNALGQDGASVAAGTDAGDQAPAWTLPPALGAGGAEGGLLAPPPSAVHYEAGCLMEALMRGRGAGLPLSMPPATACAAEADLLGEALRLFRAVPGEPPHPFRYALFSHVSKAIYKECHC